jgi:flagellar biosynthesis/type III secretory pathway protein FliH
MNGKEWFEIHLEDISSKEDFEEAMELAHVKGFEDGFQAGEEEGYNSGIYSSVVEDNIKEAINAEQERIIKSMQDRYDQILEVEGIVVGQERLDLLIELMEEITGIGHLKKREQE